jgi:hypothetical protein
LDQEAAKRQDTLEHLQKKSSKQKSAKHQRMLTLKDRPWLQIEI